VLISRLKPINEVHGYLDHFDSSLLLACNGCGESFGNSELHELKCFGEDLKNKGIHIVSVHSIDFMCEPMLVKHWLQIASGKNEYDSVLVISCGIGVQVVSQETRIPVFPACDTVTMGGRFGQAWGKQLCKECGECVLPLTAGVCPLTACSKGLLNGPCGGSEMGRCELFPETRECGWHIIYERLKAVGRTDLLKGNPLVKDYSKCEPPNELISLRNEILEKEVETL
jgi:hypothetical protein